MTETKIERLANIQQLFFFITDALKDGVEVEESIIVKAEKSLPKIQELLKEIETEKYECDTKAIKFAKYILNSYWNCKKSCNFEEEFNKFLKDNYGE